MEFYHKGNALFVDEQYEEAAEVSDIDEHSLFARIHNVSVVKSVSNCYISVSFEFNHRFDDAFCTS